MNDVAERDARQGQFRMTLTAQILAAVGGALAVLIALGVTVSVQMASIDADSRKMAADQTVMSKSVLT